MTTPGKLEFMQKKITSTRAEAESFLDTPPGEIEDIDHFTNVELRKRLQILQGQLKMLVDEHQKACEKADSDVQLRGTMKVDDLNTVHEFIFETQEFMSTLIVEIENNREKIAKSTKSTEKSEETENTNTATLKEELEKMQLLHAQEMEKKKIEMDQEREKKKLEMEERKLEMEERKLEMEKRKLETEQEIEKMKLAHQNEVEKMKMSENNASPQNTAAESCIKLPKLDFNKFSGNILDWQEFWDSFESAIDSNTKLRNVDKLNYLKSKLDGKAKSVIAGLELTNENYKVAVDLLNKRYANKRKIVNCRYEAILEMRQSSGDATELRQLFDAVETHLRALEALGETVDTNLMILIIWLKLPMGAKVYLDEKIDDGSWNLETFRKNMNIYINARCQNLDKSASIVNHQPETAPATAEMLLAADSRRSSNSTFKKRCIYCKADHWSDECEKYANIDERKAMIKGHCFKCFNRNHNSSNCTVEKECVYCKKKNLHHRSLCPTKFSGEEHATLATDSDENKIDTSQLLATGQKVLMQTAFVEASGPARGISHKVRVLLDSGSQRSYMTESLSNKLQLQKEKEKTLSVFTFGNDKAEKVKTSTVSVDLILKDGKKYDVKLDVVPKITGKLKRAGINTDALKKKWNPIMSNLADNLPTEDEQSTIEILIGNDYYWDIITGEKIEITPGLYFVNSKFGWMLTGRLASIEDEHLKVDESAMLLLTTREVPDLCYESKLTSKETENLAMEHFWKLETIGIHDPIEENDDDQALKMFNENVTYEDGRYYVTWPWKSENPQIPDNYEMSKCRLKQLTKKLAQNPAALKKYDDILQEQLQKGIIERVDEHTDCATLKHYIPHHAVITPQKTTTKVRIVYDASAKMKHHKSLNECLYRGPVMLEDLCLLLMRMRLWKIAVVADIEKAFLQIGLQEHDRDVTRFLWIKDINEPVVEDNIEVMRFSRVPFGVIASQFLLCATVLYHLNRIGTPTAKKMSDNIYVDNVMCGVSSVEEAVSIYKEGKMIFKQASMNLREWTSNSPEFNATIPPDDRTNSDIMKVLGLNWCMKSDELSINDSFKEIDMPFTKRYILKRIAGIFDPLGFVNPVTVKAKLFLQMLWKEGVQWDEHLNDEMSKQWQVIEEELNMIHTLKVPRFISYGGKMKITMLCFCDASALCYSTAVYMKIQSDEHCQVNLCFSKTRVTPKRKLSLPRLELLAVLIGIRCMNWIEQGLKAEVEKKHLWTDSQCVLKWLQSKKPLSVFVENRINEIKKTEDVTYHYVNTHENPADLLTRGKSFGEIKDSTFWWEGPTWLNDDECKWPNWDVPILTPEVLSEIEREVKGPKTLHEMTCTSQENSEENSPNTPFQMDIDAYSSLGKLLNVTAWVFRFIQKSRKLTSEKGSLKAPEISHAKKLWCMFIQKTEYPGIMEAKTEKQKNMISQLNLCEDEEGLIRCFGRLQHADICQDAKFPILLPKKHRFTQLVVLNDHRKILHAGVSHTLACVRNEFWIPHGRAEVRRILLKCQICKRHDGGPYKLPEMPPLPLERVTSVPAFTFTGLDYLGPLYIRGESVKKVWICLFTCMVVRAVHLEIVEDMTADQFLMCLRRFIARRGKPNQIVSDNAPQMKLVDKTLDTAWKDNVVDNEDVQSYVANEGIKWKFIPEYAPWMGGFYERLVQSVKKPLRKAIGKNCLSYVQLETLLTEIEAVLNSRPLCYVGDESDLGHIITPNHYLSMNQNSGLVDLNIDLEDPDFIAGVNSVQQLLTLWKKGQNLLNNFWTCWRNDYLQSLRERYQKEIKCSRIKSDEMIKIGHIVLIKDSMPRGSWRLGRVCELIQSFDGEIRSAKVKMANGKLFQRPINLLFPIEVSCDNVESGNSVDDKKNPVNDEVGKYVKADVPRPVRQAAIEARRKMQHMMD